MQWVQSTTSAGKQFFEIFWHTEKTSVSAAWKLNTWLLVDKISLNSCVFLPSVRERGTGGQVKKSEEKTSADLGDFFDLLGPMHFSVVRSQRLSLWEHLASHAELFFDTLNECNVLTLLWVPELLGCPLPCLPHWLKRYHCLFCKQWVMVVSKVTAMLWLSSSTKKKRKKRLRTPESIPLSPETVGERKELPLRATWVGY